MKLHIAFLLLFITNCSFTQFSISEYQNKVDSMIELKPTLKNLEVLNEIAFTGKYIDFKITDKAADFVLKHSKKPKFESVRGFAFKLKGIVADETGKYKAAIENYLLAIEAYKKAKSQLDIAKCEANIGMIFRHQQKFKESLNYFKNSLSTFEKEEFVFGVININNNLGIVYLELEQADSSLYFLKKAEAMMLEIGEFDANIYGNLGNTYYSMGKNKLALENYKKCIDYFEENRILDQSIAVWYFSYAGSLMKLGKNEQALAYLTKAKNVIGNNIYTREAKSLYSIIGELNFKLGNYKASAEAYDVLSQIKDSLYSADNSKLTSDLSEKYQTEKKVLEIENLSKEKKIEKEKRINEEQKVFYLIIGAILMSIILVYSFISIKIKISDNKKIKENNKLIQLQKEIVEEKSKEILDSIQYAKRLQDAILPNIKLVKEHFLNSFILFKPKDIVSGDFYWMETKENLVMFAAADCTGHGVPGAMVSVVCANALNKSVNEFHLTDPAKILDKTREFVVETFTKTGSDVKDGMDISICVYNTDTNELLWSGANNPLWIVRNQAAEIEVIAPNKQPIGIYEKNTEFTSHLIKINEGDSVYLFSDGYADQFGGEKEKKFTTTRFKNAILGMQNQTMIEQKESLTKTFEDWKGDLEQLDDICVIGVKF